jgi:hypothetical protein
VDQFASHQANNGSVGWISQFQFSQMFDPHIRGHTRRNQLDDLKSLLADHMCPQYAVRLLGYDHLTETFLVIIYHSTI